MEHISWKLYVLLLCAVVGSYYLYVGIRYYRREVQNLAAKTFKPPDRKELETITVEELEALNQGARLLEESFQALNGLEITAEEALSLAREQLSRISGLKNPVVRQTLEQLVAHQTQTAFGLQLSRSELKTIW